MITCHVLLALAGGGLDSSRRSLTNLLNFPMQEQKLRPGESIDMPIFFYIDPEYATDPRLRHINALTLSYTFFKVSEDEEYQQMPVPVPIAAQA